MNSWQVVDQLGRVHMRSLTQDDANGAVVRLVGMMPNLTMRAERAGQTPVVAPAPIAEPLPAITQGDERESLREAIECHLDASARLDAANQAVELARAFLDARQVELDALRAAHADEIRNAGVNLAETLKTGGTLEVNRVIDRSALLDAEVRRDTAREALAQLTAEQTAADAAHMTAETRVRLDALSVMRADVQGMVDRLEALQREAWGLRFAISAAKLYDIPETIRTQAVMANVPPGDVPTETECSGQWARYSAALRENHEAEFGEA